MTCKDCLHYELCRYNTFQEAHYFGKDKEIYITIDNNSPCKYFADRSEWVHLPCKVGDIFFKPLSWRNTIDKCTVSSLTQKADKTWKIRLTSGVFRTTFEITINDIGKTVFLTHEEAEKVLEEKK